MISAVDHWATHQPVLIACAMRARGPVVECGAGHYSTPLLRTICAELGLPLISFDECEEWAVAMTKALNGRHVVQHCLDIPAALREMPEVPDLLFVDNGAFRISPLYARTWCMKVARDRGVPVIVAHDTEPVNRHKYRFLESFEWFRYRVDFEGKCYNMLGDKCEPVPWASALSNTDDLTWLRHMLPE